MLSVSISSELFNAGIRIVTIVQRQGSMHFEEMNTFPIPLKSVNFKAFHDSIFPLCMNNYVKICSNSNQL